MRTATDLLIQYARYHRDRRNIASHFVGVPMIVFAVGVLLARPAFTLGSLELSPAWIVFALAAAWYLSRGCIALGVAVSAGVGLLMLVAHQVAYGSIASWLGWGVVTFIVGWVVQFIGHWYEGRKPAFVDDVVGLLVGPMFVTAEALFMFGWNKPLLAEIERRVGPTVLRDIARIA
ncbi:MAG: Mpo1-like protein [Burkholderiaceae bacterium]